MRWQLLILMNENCWWPENPLYIHLFRLHQTTSPHPRATSGPPPGHLSPTVYLLSALAPVRWRTVCLSPHAVADRGWCGGGPWLQGSCKGPWWRKCRFYPPANPWSYKTDNHNWFKTLKWRNITIKISKNDDNIDNVQKKWIKKNKNCCI